MIFVDLGSLENVRNLLLYKTRIKKGLNWIYDESQSSSTHVWLQFTYFFYKQRYDWLQRMAMF